MVTFAKLNIDKESLNEVKTIEINGFEVNVKQYLPINKKLEINSNVLNYLIAAEQGSNIKFYNPMVGEMLQVVEIINAYTDISFTDVQLGKNIAKTYDLLDSSGVAELIINTIPAEELKIVSEGIDESIDAYYKYKQSALGILDSISNDYKNLNLDVDKLREKMQDKETFKILPEIMDKLN